MHRAADEARSKRVREAYAMLGLRVVCHKDRSLEDTWGSRCHEWLERGPTSHILRPLSRTELAAKLARLHRFEGGQRAQ